MRSFKIFNKVVLVILLIFLIKIYGCTDPKLLCPKHYDFSLLSTKIQSWIDSGYYSGAAIEVYRDNAQILKSTFGNYTDTINVFIASSGKWLVAATIAAVVDEGKLQWNDNVNKWLPQFTDQKGEATLKQLLSHTSGYPDYQPMTQPKDIYQTLEKSVAHIVELNADTTPGAVFHYGGLAMQVAGRMAELATGKDWEAIFQEKIAQPLGMNHTHFTPVDSSDGHNPMLGGGARSTLSDYTAFLNMIFNDGVFNNKRILSSGVIKEMQADQVKKAKILRREYVQSVRTRFHTGIYGLGLWREEINDNGDALLISSPSWAGAYPWIDYSTNSYGFFITHVNAENANKKGFNAFYSSPVLPVLLRDIYKKAALPDSVETGFVSTGDTSMYYEETDSDEPVTFIHDHSFDNSEWGQQFTVFTEKHRTVQYVCRRYRNSLRPVER
ncbi:serine hydrolase domain-containing protein [Geofilum sp. OHC36d9]|uniref:serine hydrolase domain-containing protein n=1 Tax=Geofilum sp. OHC36d9 TaxID=3458413 RepID=UPI0040344D29